MTQTATDRKPRVFVDYLSTAIAGTSSVREGDEITLAKQQFSVGFNVLGECVLHCRNCGGTLAPRSLDDVEKHLVTHPDHLRTLLVELATVDESATESLRSWIGPEMLAIIATRMVGRHVRACAMASLTEAVENRQMWSNDPAGWCDQHDVGIHSAADHIENRIDAALDEVLG